MSVGPLCEFTQAVSSGFNSPYVHYLLGEALLDQKKADEAIGEFTQAVSSGLNFDIKHRLAVAHNNYGLQLADEGKLQQALQEFATALDNDPNLSVAQKNLGHFRNKSIEKSVGEQPVQPWAVKPPASRNTSTTQSETYSVVFRNDCTGHAIFLSVMFRDDDGRWVTQGWWHIQPSEQVNPFSTRNSIFYYFAQSDDAGPSIVWNGEARKGAVAADVISEPFLYRNGEELHGNNKRTVSMRMGKMDRTDFLVPLTCPLTSREKLRQSKPQGCCCEPGESNMDCFRRCNAAVLPCP